LSTERKTRLEFSQRWRCFLRYSRLRRCVYHTGGYRLFGGTVVSQCMATSPTRHYLFTTKFRITCKCWCQ